MKKVLLIIIGIALIGLAIITWGKSLTIINDGIIITVKSSDKAIESSGEKKVEGDSYHPYLIGTNINEAVDKALEKAGPEYDMLIDATLEVNYYYMIIYFSNYITVTGTAVNSDELKAEMGEENYHRWLAGKNVMQSGNID